MKFIIIKIVIEFLIFSIVEWYYSSMPPILFKWSWKSLTYISTKVSATFPAAHGLHIFIIDLFIM
jgi:hypothetical protein